MRQVIITISNVDTDEYFFTTDHCQKHNLGNSWVPCTTTIPITVAVREALPTGIVNNKEDYKKVFDTHMREIPNPQPEYQA